MTIFKALCLTCCSLLFVCGCESTYYATMEQVGVHKRDILKDRVEEAKEAQGEAQQEFKDALEQFSVLVNFDGGELQDMYEQTEDAYESSADAAAEVTERIDGIETVADALFDEWDDELTQYTNANLKQQSAQKLKATKRQYTKLLKSMRRAESKMAPVLAALKDNTLYLKHNLNAQAVGSLKGEYQRIKKDTDLLILEMNKAISESEAFIATLK
ncbi:DUF2959 domain-containing protein [Corallincola luteus]|uniref:DUF2959 domain-containing protein n=2 Tax=Corallincola TaxID=1775176 RepID=A0A368NKM2_9GAMM|nr:MULTISPECIES: DUF2959 domain-containing protein [Corallincola]RCU50998.1 DUF2959 domain-containing protein [Corallincola holothuriorum]TCI04059.1 DUF2959 domain-containing protein [Corallincola luteus]